VAVRADPEQDEVETLRKLDLGRPQRMDLLLGNGNTGEERLARQPLVGALVVRRNVPLVRPPDVPRAPDELRRCEALVDGADRRPAGQRDSEGPPLQSAVGDPPGRERR